MKKIILSIIIPIYNVDKYLRECLESIVSQNHNACEIILIDDGSTDNSGLICDEYSGKHPNVSTYHKNNGGLSDARNYGLGKATGEYIMFVDSDDYLANNAIQYFLDMIKKYNADVFVGKSYAVDEDGTIRDELQYSIKEGPYTVQQYLKTLYKNPKSVLFCVQYHICKRDVIVKNDLCFEFGIIHEDELWTPNLLLASETVYYCDYFFYYHRMRNGSIMHSPNNEKSGNSLLKIAEELCPLYDKYEKEGYDVRYLRNRMATFYLQAATKLGRGSLWLFKRKLPLQNSTSPLLYMKSLLFFVSPRLYLDVWEIKYKNQ